MTSALALALILTALQPPDADAVARELKVIEQRLASAWKSGDCTAWGSIVADDWSVIHITGEIITRTQALEMCNGSATPLERLDLDQISVRVFKDTAIVTGRTTVTTGGAQSLTLTLRFTDVFICRGDRWQVVASHATRLAQ